MKAIDGIDEVYEELLRKTGFASIASVAAADPETISMRFESEEPDRMPSRSTIEGWIASADKLEK